MIALTRRRAVVAGLAAVVCIGAFAYRFSAAEPAPPFPKDGPAVPLGLPPIIWPKDNKYSPEKAELGWLLYFDKRLSGDATVSCASCHDPRAAFTDSQKRGLVVFFSNNARCDSCHEGANFTNGKYANVGIGMDRPSPDLGRYAVTRDEADRGAFKTPTLRDVALTGPYMHDGSLKTL